MNTKSDLRAKEWDDLILPRPYRSDPQRRKRKTGLSLGDHIEDASPHRTHPFFFFLQRHFSLIPPGKHKDLRSGLDRSGINSRAGRRRAPPSCGRLPDDDAQYYQHHGHDQCQDAHLLTGLLLWTREGRVTKRKQTHSFRALEADWSPGPGPSCLAIKRWFIRRAGAK